MRTIFLAVAALGLPATAHAWDYTMLIGGDDNRGGYIVCVDGPGLKSPKTAFLPGRQVDLLIDRGSDGVFYFRTSVFRDLNQPIASGVIETNHPAMPELFETCLGHVPMVAERAIEKLRQLSIASGNGKQPDGGWSAIVQRLKTAGYL